MRLHTVTITGPDDQTDLGSLVQLSAAFPFVEWGILLTRRRGRPTFPSDAWLQRLRSQTPPGVRLSAHICGSWAEEICRGRWPEQIDLTRFARVQLNIAHCMGAVESPGAVAACLPVGPDYILQVGTARERGLALAEHLRGDGIPVSILFDASRGRGISPRTWPAVPAELRCGFAGGLGPDNMHEQLGRLQEIVGDRPVWIDMQSRVRSSDGTVLDLAKVRRCLEICRPFTLAEPQGR